MKAFRIDNRAFQNGQSIEPQHKYQNELDETRKSVEEILEKHRPDDKPPRDSILMLFANFEDAKHHWTIQSKSKFYQLNINETAILHTGDYNKVEELYKAIDNEVEANKIAQEYWQENMTDNPKPEVFVKSGTINQVISESEDERKNALAIRMGFALKQEVRIISENE